MSVQNARLVYLDHNAVIGLEKPDVQECLTEAQGLGATFVVSLFHTIELAKDDNDGRRAQLIERIEGIRPKWLRERLQIEHQEVAQEFFKWLRVPWRRPRSVTSLWDAVRDLTPAIRHNVSLKQLVDSYRAEMNSTIEALRSQQQVRAGLDNIIGTSRLSESQHRQIMARLVLNLAPRRTPAGVIIDQETRKQFAADSHQLDGDAFRTLRVEYEWLQDSRIVGQSLGWNNFVDRYHLITALPNVDLIVTEDRPLARQAERVSGALSVPLARVVTIDGLHSALSSPPDRDGSRSWSLEG